MENLKKFILMCTLTSSSYLCPMLWKGLYVDPVGVVGPCCVGPVAGNIQSASLQDLWNSETIQDCRRRMLRGERIPECKVCYNQEDRGMGSVRINYVKEFESRKIDIPRTVESDFDPRIVDLRLSNLCNLKCKTCWSGNSSKWQAEIGLPDGIQVTTSKEKDEIKQVIQSHLDDFIEIYFAGGEPTIIKEDWEILKECVLSRKTNIFLRYSTNLMNLNFEGQNIVDWWEQWAREKGRLELNISIDGTGDVVEYVRTGAKWETLDKNIKEVRKRLQHYGNVRLSFAPVVSTLNVLHIPTLIRYGERLKIDVTLNNVLFWPPSLDLKNLTDKAKDSIRGELAASCVTNNQIKYKNTVYEHLDKPHVAWDQKFLEECNRLYDEKFNEINPPLTDWWKSIKI